MNQILMLLMILLPLSALVAWGERKGYVKPKSKAVQPPSEQPPGIVAVETAPQAVAVPVGPRKTTYRQKYCTSHAGHALGTIITAGLWAPMWAVFTVANKVHPGRKVTERHHY